mmetsp:Transcript_30289/g.77234  ORF Transcript_30289/g.77234 Transcript_30289/m.77234 type:complete len:212 (+) Transcript_30289:338-973(+)
MTPPCSAQAHLGSPYPFSPPQQPRQCPSCRATGSTQPAACQNSGPHNVDCCCWCCHRPCRCLLSLRHKQVDLGGEVHQALGREVQAVDEAQDLLLAVLVARVLYQRLLQRLGVYVALGLPGLPEHVERAQHVGALVGQLLRARHDLQELVKVHLARPVRVDLLQDGVQLVRPHPHAQHVHQLLDLLCVQAATVVLVHQVKDLPELRYLLRR